MVENKSELRPQVVWAAASALAVTVVVAATSMCVLTDLLSPEHNRYVSKAKEQREKHTNDNENASCSQQHTCSHTHTRPKQGHAPRCGQMDMPYRESS